VFEAMDACDYDLLGCELVRAGVAETRIDPHGYPYGGIAALIGLAEAFGFTVLGVNEHGKYESRAKLLGSKDSTKRRKARGRSR
jgi:hypothetical protein